VPWLCRLTGDMQATARDAIRALINIGADVTTAMEDMARAGVINGVMEVAAEQEQVCACAYSHIHQEASCCLSFVVHHITALEALPVLQLYTALTATNSKQLQHSQQHHAKL
jgi:hypothetical protein